MFQIFIILHQNILIIHSKIQVGKNSIKAKVFLLMLVYLTKH
jgi:hypothetical protein